MKMDNDTFEELRSAAENFQQAMAGIAGPYADAEKRIMAAAYEDGIRKDDLDSLVEMMESLVQDLEGAAYEAPYALEEFQTLVEEAQEMADEDEEVAV